MTLALRTVHGRLQFAVKVVPGASQNRIAGRFGDALKVQVTAPPEGGRANAAVITLLAEALGVAERQIALLAGATAPRKTLAVAGITAEALLQRLGLTPA